MNNKQKLLLVTVTIIAIIAIAISTVTLTVNSPSTTKLNIVATFYPITYLTQEIGGDQINITQLVPANTDVHSWEPSASHIIAAENADIIIYNGAGLDSWVQHDILPTLSSKNRTIVDSSAGLELLAKQEKTPEPKAGQEEKHVPGEYDPHIWVSPYMAKQQAQNIYKVLIQTDPEHESYYTQRWSNLEAKLDQLEDDYLNTLGNTTKNTIFVSHEAFGYIASRYGFEQHGVIGLSADEQPSAATLANLVATMVAYETYTVYVDPIYSNKYAQTIQTEVQTQTGKPVTILELYLILGPTDNMDLLEQMQINLTNLKIGLEPTMTNTK